MRIPAHLLLLFIPTFACLAQESGPVLLDMDIGLDLDLPGSIHLAYGLNFLDDKPDIKPFSSGTLAVGYASPLPLFGPIHFVPSVEIRCNSLGFDQDMNFIQMGDKTTHYAAIEPEDPKSSDFELLQNKLVIASVVLGGDLRYYPFYKPNDRTFFIGVNGFLGLRFRSNTRIKHSVGDKKLKEKTFDDFDLSRFQYGVGGKLGWDPIYFAVLFNLQPLFTTSPVEVDPRLWSLGLVLSGL